MKLPGYRHPQSYLGRLAARSTAGLPGSSHPCWVRPPCPDTASALARRGFPRAENRYPQSPFPRLRLAGPRAARLALTLDPSEFQVPNTKKAGKAHFECKLLKCKNFLPQRRLHLQGPRAAGVRLLAEVDLL